jgi:hypothetical protein
VGTACAAVTAGEQVTTVGMVCRTRVTTGVGAASAATAAGAMVGAAGGTGTTFWAGAADRTAALCGAGPDSGRGTGPRASVKGFALPTACRMGRRMPTVSAGWTASRGADAAGSTLATVECTTEPALGSASDDPVLMTWIRPVPGNPGSSSAWLSPDPSNQPTATRPLSTTARSSARMTPRSAYLAPPASGLAATGSPSTKSARSGLARIVVDQYYTL